MAKNKTVKMYHYDIISFVKEKVAAFYKSRPNCNRKTKILNIKAYYFKNCFISDLYKIKNKKWSYCYLRKPVAEHGLCSWFFKNILLEPHFFYYHNTRHLFQSILFNGRSQVESFIAITAVTNCVVSSKIKMFLNLEQNGFLICFESSNK